jgi:hypothetical protein
MVEAGLARGSRPLIAGSGRNIVRDQALASAWQAPRADLQQSRVYMARREHRQIVETPTEARQGEPGPSVLALVVVSTGLAILVLGVIWFVFFRT